MVAIWRVYRGQSRFPFDVEVPNSTC